jgi:hypothetical protein
MTIRFACLILKATDTHLECVIIIAFPLQQWLHERAPLFRLHVLCLSCSYQTLIKPENFLIGCRKTCKYQILKIIKIRPVGVELFLADRQTT